MPAVIYGGGPIISTVEVVTVFIGNDNSLGAPDWTSKEDMRVACDLNAYFAFLVRSSYFFKLRAAYPTPAIDYGTLRGTQRVLLPPNNNGRFSFENFLIDSNITATLKQFVLPVYPPRKDASSNSVTLYMVVLARGITVKSPLPRSVPDDPYHAAFTKRVGNVETTDLLYAVIMASKSVLESYRPYSRNPNFDPINPDSADLFDVFTSTGSHELVEAVTSAIPFKGWTYLDGEEICDKSGAYDYHTYSVCWFPERSNGDPVKLDQFFSMGNTGQGLQPASPSISIRYHIHGIGADHQPERVLPGSHLDFDFARFNLQQDDSTLTFLWQSSAGFPNSSNARLFFAIMPQETLRVTLTITDLLGCQLVASIVIEPAPLLAWPPWLPRPGPHPVAVQFDYAVPGERHRRPLPLRSSTARQIESILRDDNERSLVDLTSSRSQLATSRHATSDDLTLPVTSASVGAKYRPDDIAVEHLTELHYTSLVKRRR